MILTCPHCSANFLVADHLVPAAGRTVRCGSCKQSWHATPDQAKATKADYATMRSDSDDAAVSKTERRFPLPAIAKKPLPSLPFLVAMPVLAILWFVTALYTNYPNWLNTPVLGGIYASLGASDTTGLRFDQYILAREEEGPQTRFVVSGIIANDANESRTVPSVAVTLLDADGDVVASRSYVVNETVAPGDNYPFRITNLSTNFGHRVTEVVVDLGHDLQLMFR